MIKEQTTFEQAQGISYTFSMVEISIKNCPGATIFEVFLEITNYPIKSIYKGVSVNIKGKRDL